MRSRPTVCLHCSMEATDCSSASSASVGKGGRELRPKPSRSKAWTGRERLSGSRLRIHRPTPPPKPCTITRGVLETGEGRGRKALIVRNWMRYCMQLLSGEKALIIKGSKENKVNPKLTQKAERQTASTPCSEALRLVLLVTVRVHIRFWSGRVTKRAQTSLCKPKQEGNRLYLGTSFQLAEV